MITERTSKILEAAIESFIDTGEPVSSSWLYRHYNFGIKPAMIRLELENLSEKGFLEQPHHSAGRVPSDKGYEFFAARLLDSESRPHVNSAPFAGLFARGAWEDFLGQLSSRLGILGVAKARENIYKTGLENLLDNFKWETPEEIKDIVHDFVEIDGRLEEAEEELRDLEPLSVFVGRKSPVTRSGELSTIACRYETGGGKVLIFTIGPKRMDYRKVLGILKTFI